MKGAVSLQADKADPGSWFCGNPPKKTLRSSLLLPQGFLKSPYMPLEPEALSG